jgi:hypothetical protein
MTEYHPADHAHENELPPRPHMAGQPAEHEPEEFDRELNLPAILWTTGGVIATCLISVVAMWGMFVGFDAFDRRHAAPPPPMAEAARQQAPLEPSLQAAPAEDMDAMRAAENKTLQHGGWVDQGHGTVRVPIDVAIEVLAERGLPHPKTPPLSEMMTHGSTADDGRPPVDQPSPGTLLPPPGYGIGNIGPPSAGAGQVQGPAMVPETAAPAPPAAPKKPLLPPPPPPPGGLP